MARPAHYVDGILIEFQRQHLMLHVANASPIHIFDLHVLTISSGHSAIIGTDFLTHQGLLIDVKEKNWLNH